ncbi:hypothetical protein GBA52_025954 [Prunus armeniaca]|nr:hypothetical protein GBA52_025954 [Prunus armeniaca]
MSPRSILGLLKILGSERIFSDEWIPRDEMRDKWIGVRVVPADSPAQAKGPPVSQNLLQR